MICPVSAVVVVFPLVPVTAISLPFRKAYPSSTSPQTGIPCARSLSAKGVSTGTPGLNTDRENSPSRSSGSSPARISTSASAGSFARTASGSVFSFSSKRTGTAFLARSSSAAAMPLFPAPMIRIFFPSTFIIFLFFPAVCRSVRPQMASRAARHRIAVRMEKNATMRVSGQPHSSK